jgi:mannose/cellobiose epimerase-like protein (N-acyl-D-glucosamine 2-epimerase family)
MRATVQFATRHGRDDLWPIYQKAQDFARIHYVDQEYGGWTRDRFVDSGKGSRELKKTIGYHVVGFNMDALSLSSPASTNQ